MLSQMHLDLGLEHKPQQFGQIGLYGASSPPKTPKRNPIGPAKIVRRDVRITTLEVFLARWPSSDVPLKPLPHNEQVALFVGSFLPTEVDDCHPNSVFSSSSSDTRTAKTMKSTTIIPPQIMYSSLVNSNEEPSVSALNLEGSYGKASNLSAVPSPSISRSKS